MIPFKKKIVTFQDVESMQKTHSVLLYCKPSLGSFIAITVSCPVWKPTYKATSFYKDLSDNKEVLNELHFLQIIIQFSL